MPGTLFVVATPIGNLEDITVRALRVLREVAVIAAEDTRRTAHLLARHAISTPMTSLHTHNESSKSGGIISRMRGGEDVALVSDAGTPTVSDPGGPLIRAAIDAGIRVEAIPGASAVLTALAVSGLPTDSFSFFGFPPIRSKDRNAWFDRVSHVRGTVVFFEAPHRIRATLEQLSRTVGDCTVSVARELTKIHEQLVRGPISIVLAGLGEQRGEFTVVAFIGLTTKITSTGPPSDSEIYADFGQMTAVSGVTRRQAITALGRKHGLPANRVYEALERFKKSVK
jgi:16S rRNA (cytidine1402-2'-O)-methyltransferase